MSKSFQVPESVLVQPWAAAFDPPAPLRLTFLVFATTVWLDDAQACLDPQGKFSLVKQRRWFDVITQFETTKPGDWITLEDQDYATLRRIVEAPQKGFPSLRTMQAGLPFSDVVLGAVDKVPEVFTGAHALVGPPPQTES